MVEGTPLLREHAAYTRIEGSNPSVSASKPKSPDFSGLFAFLIKGGWARVQKHFAWISYNRPGVRRRGAEADSMGPG